MTVCTGVGKRLHTLLSHPTLELGGLWKHQNNPAMKNVEYGRYIEEEVGCVKCPMSVRITFGSSSLHDVANSITEIHEVGVQLFEWRVALYS